MELGTRGLKKLVRFCHQSPCQLHLPKQVRQLAGGWRYGLMVRFEEFSVIPLDIYDVCTPYSAHTVHRMRETYDQDVTFH